MSANGFAFPPPPPPPPRRSHDDHVGSVRGRSRGGGPPRGRGASQGGFTPRSNYGSGRGRGNYQSNYIDSPSTRPSSHTPTLSPPHKRDYATAFSKQPSTRPQAPAPVPSFNAGLENLLAPKTTSSPPQKQQNKTNLLGLTPSTAEASDSDDDRDEEARLAEASLSTDLQFEYKGHTSMLRTPAEIAAWLVERKKRWPTEARREAANKEEEERKRRWQEEKQKKAEAFRAEKQTRMEQRRPDNSTRHGSKKTWTSLPAGGSASDPGNSARLRAEHLRRKAAKAQRELEEAEKELLKSRHSMTSTDNTSSTHQNVEVAEPDHDTSSLSDSSHLTDSHSDTSSASDSDDSGPEEMSSKVEVDKLSAPLENRARVKKPCQFFAKHGSCRYGTRCKYAHDSDPAQKKGSAVASTSNTGRKGLWQVMMEKEREEENKKVLSAIIALGKQGVLDDDELST